MIPLLRDRGLGDRLRPGDLETLATGFRFTEGPLAMPDGSLLFQDIQAERTYRIDPGPGAAAVLVRERTAAANGQTWMADGRIVFCEQNGRRVSAVSPRVDAQVSLLEAWEGKRLNSPNDVVCRSDGQIFFTDPPYGVTPETKELPFQAVWKLDPVSGFAASPLIDDFEKPNGLAFSPDERTLYVCDTARYHVRAFDVSAEGSLSNGRVFAVQDPGENGGPDGMKVDREGRIYVAVALGIWVYEPDGTLLGILGMPSRPSNLAWWGRDFDHLGITAGDTVYRLRLGVPGLPPPFLPPPR
ncbi:MAG: SMP-30/gluconolactonase/LRE family protein [Isosphaeraceae bacterium]